MGGGPGNNEDEEMRRGRRDDNFRTKRNRDNDREPTQKRGKRVVHKSNHLDSDVKDLVDQAFEKSRRLLLGDTNKLSIHKRKEFSGKGDFKELNNYLGIADKDCTALACFGNCANQKCETMGIKHRNKFPSLIINNLKGLLTKYLGQ